VEISIPVKSISLPSLSFQINQQFSGESSQQVLTRVRQLKKMQRTELFGLLMTPSGMKHKQKWPFQFADVCWVAQTVKEEF